MAKRLALLLAFVAAFASSLVLPATAAAQSNTPDDVAADIDAYWRAEFAERGLSYSSPGLRVVYDTTATGCGLIDPYFGPAGYCTIDNVIYVSPLWLDVSGQDSTLWYVVLAHEWGHHIQALLGLESTVSVETEKQADCLAGAYAADAVERGFAPQSIYNIGMYLQIVVGDPPFLPDDLRTHPVGGERGSEFAQGWLGGPGECGVGL
jgi:uncharacterized protein